MSEPAAPTDPLMAMMANNIPETVEDMRNMLDGLGDMLNGGVPEVGVFHEKVPVDGCPAEVTADVIVPKGDGPFPVLVYLHGGGWICGSPTTHKKLGHRFAEAGYLVFNVDYRMAPEFPFPTPFEDCVESIRWAHRVADQYGGDSSRLAVGGDSAGGNLTAAASIALADDPTVKIGAALLIYGVFDFATMSAVAPGASPNESPGMSGEMAEKMAEVGPKMTELMTGSYLGSESERQAKLADPRVSPIHAAERLPPSHIVCGGADSLVEQTKVLAERLTKAGVDHEHIIVPDMPHGFAQMEFFPQARESIDKMVAFLNARLS